MAMQAAARPVHPHMRGVYEGFKLDDTPHYGSSPRAWGLPLSNAEICCDCRSIPTYVGFTRCWLQSKRAQPVHPHIRGVYWSKIARRISIFGPSPHTWGLLSETNLLLVQNRSIPTYVGFTLLVENGGLDEAVHPHIRGVFGQQVGNRVFVARSIPTYVGFSKFQSGACWYMPVHPHIRGVFAVCFMPQRSEGGPSPHTWGFLPSLHPSKTVTRSIPTYVGFSFRYSRNGE